MVGHLQQNPDSIGLIESKSSLSSASQKKYARLNEKVKYFHSTVVRDLVSENNLIILGDMSISTINNVTPSIIQKQDSREQLSGCHKQVCNDNIAVSKCSKDFEPLAKL